MTGLRIAGVAIGLILGGGAVTAQAAPLMDYYGIISCAEGQAGCTPGTGGGGSSQPARIFGFDDGDAAPTFFGEIALGAGNVVDADALAYSSLFPELLFAFALDHAAGSSQLMAININDLTAGGPGVFATPVGPELDGLDARGATFQPGTSNLFVLDSNGDATAAGLGVLSIVDSGGTLGVGTGVGGDLDRAVGTATDIAFNTNGDLILTTEVPSSATSPWGFYRINPPAAGGTTFTTDLLTRDTNTPLQAYVGLAISSAGILGLDVNGDDDIYSIDPALAPPNLNGPGDRTLVYGDIFGSLNAGRGDLTTTLPIAAVATVPEPGALTLMGLGLLGLGVLRRRRP